MKPTYAGEVLVRFCGDNEARIVGHDLRLRSGGRYMAAFVPIDSDEAPVEEVLPPRHKLSNLAAILTKDQAFIVRARGEGCTPDEYLKKTLGIKSKAELDTDPQAAERFLALLDRHSWVMPARHEGNSG